MIGEYRIKTNIGVGFGILAQIIGFLASYYVHIGIVLWCAAILIYGGYLPSCWHVLFHGPSIQNHTAWQTGPSRD